MWTPHCGTRTTQCNTTQFYVSGPSSTQCDVIIDVSKIQSGASVKISLSILIDLLSDHKSNKFVNDWDWVVL